MSVSKYKVHNTTREPMLRGNLFLTHLNLSESAEKSNIKVLKNVSAKFSLS